MKILAAAIDGLPEQASVLLQLGVVREDLGGLLQLNQGGHQAAHLGWKWKGRLNGKVSPILCLMGGFTFWSANALRALIAPLASRFPSTWWGFSM